MEKCYGNSSETSSVCAWHFQWLNLTLPYPEEVLVSPEYGGLGVGMDLGVHVGLPHLFNEFFNFGFSLTYLVLHIFNLEQIK